MWVVTGNMYDGGYGSYVGLIDVFNDELSAKLAAVDSDATEIEIHEIEPNKVYGGQIPNNISSFYQEPEIYLGGYAE